MSLVKYDVIIYLYLRSLFKAFAVYLYVDTPRVILLVTVFFVKQVNMVIIELYKPRVTHMKYIKGK